MSLSSNALTLRALFGIDNDQVITGVSCDSREIKPNMIFAALPGTLVDGRDFIGSAIDNGAAAILTTHGTAADVPVIHSAEPRLDYAYLAKVFFPKQPETLVAMTGTNGKSSTVEFLRQIWAHAGLKAACFGTLGVTSHIGYRPLTHTTPDALSLHQTLHDLANAGVTHVAMEASSHGLDQYRLDAINVSAAGFSNLTQDHFDYHPDMSDYFAAKARLFTDITPEGAPVIINTNDEYGRKLVNICEGRGQEVMQVGWSGEHIRIDELMPHGASQILTLIVMGERHKIELPLAGEFQALNAVAALGLALNTGVSLEGALGGLKTLKGVSGRMERAGQTKDGAPIFVDFAHTEDGLDKLLRGLRPHIMGKLVIVFGCGGDRDPDKRAKMGAMATRLADDVIVTDDNPRTEDAASIRQAVMQGCRGASNVADRAEAIALGISRLGPSDGLVIAGKGHEQGQIIGNKVIPFNDVDEVHKVLQAEKYV
ncbi:MAG: UDP-N-acetylmuramoyl-L-alanyl-D-glutamate--2,6-diaminopimelate ligase [Litorimonas sp.]